MNRLAWAASATLAACLAACGGGSSGSSGSSAPPAPSLQYIEIDNTSPVVAPGASLPLSCIGYFSDNTSSPVVALWGESSGGSWLSLSANQGDTINVNGVAEGFAFVTAMVSGVANSQVLVIVSDADPSEDPGPFYASGMPGISEYSSPGGFPASAWSLAGKPKGFSYGTGALYALNGGGDAITKFDLGTSTESPVADLTPTQFAISMDRDSTGLLYTVDYGSGTVWRIDPADGSVVGIGNAGGGRNGLVVTDLGLGAGEQPFVSPLTTSPGGPWILKLSGAGYETWAVMPANVNAAAFYFTSRTMDSSVGYAAHAMDNTVYRHEDLNGDGDALDAGETTVYVTFGFASGGTADQIFGMSAMNRGWTLVVNVQNGTSPDAGMWWFADLNRDGAMDPLTEKTYYGPANDNMEDSGLVRLIRW